jgi:FKBP-type peptidyl-prolyl cis-trans isomerase FklB
MNSKMKKSAFLLATTAVALSLKAQEVKKPAIKPASKLIIEATKPVADATSGIRSLIDTVSYGIGVSIGYNLKGQGMENVNLAILQKGINDLLKGKKLAIADSSLNATLQAFYKTKMDEKEALDKKEASAAKKEGEAFLEANAKRKGVSVLSDGLQYEILKTGSDTTKPKLEDKVKCHYHGTLINGKVFDSSVDRGEPITFPLSNVIKGWQEAVQMMTVGSKWRLFIPSDLAYGDRSNGAIPGGSTLIYDVELLGIEK